METKQGETMDFVEQCKQLKAKFIEAYGVCPNAILLGEKKFFNLRNSGELSLRVPMWALEIEGMSIHRTTGVEFTVALILKTP